MVMLRNESDKDKIKRLTAELAKERAHSGGLESGLLGIRRMLAGYAGQPNVYGDLFKIADAALKKVIGKGL